MFRVYFYKIAALVCIIRFISCSDTADAPTETALTPGLQGSGFFTYTGYAPLAAKPIKVYFYIPALSNTTTPIVFLFHGDDRNAFQYRDALINKAETYKFILIAPEFSEANYPTGDNYNLGNVFVDGDNPSASTLNQESQWTFSVIEPLFDYVKQTMLNTSTSYDIIGHSAGAQFAHRFVMFKPNARFDTVIASAAGWYTVPNVTIDFPYGFRNSPLANHSLALLYSKKLHILVGSLDNDPNSPGLRRNPQADAQGINRFSRAYHFFNYGNSNAAANNTNFQWQITTAPGLNHDYIPAINFAADVLF